MPTSGRQIELPGRLRKEQLLKSAGFHAKRESTHHYKAVQEGTYSWIYMRLWVFVCGVYVRVWLWKCDCVIFCVGACLCVCVWVCACVCACVCGCVWLCVYVCMCMCVWRWVCICLLKLFNYYKLLFFVNSK